MNTLKYGLDFGTTNSSIALLEKKNDGTFEPKIFDVDTYEKPFQIIRSVVAYDKFGVYVGNEGLENVNGDEDNPIRNIKLMLRDEHRDGFAGTDNNNNKLSISDVMKEILMRLKREADKQLPHNIVVDGVVVGVPVETPESEKSVYLHALVKAGFYTSYEEAKNKTEFIEEPIAVAIFYGNQNIYKNKLALVFDYGGGTLDLSIVQFKGGDIPHEVIAKSGLSSAGERLTELLFLDVFYPNYCNEYCGGSSWEMSKLFRKMGTGANSAAGVWQRMQNTGLGWKFINELDRAKARLSFEESISFSFFEPANENHGSIEFKPITITRKQFEEVAEKELSQIIPEIEKLFKSEKCKKNNIKASDIQDVFLAGGSSAIPLVRRLIKEKFPEKVRFDDTTEGNFYIKSMTSIAQGLAIAGCREASKMLVDDITSFDYGYWDYSKNEMKIIIPKGTKISDTDCYDFSRNGIQPNTPYREPIHQLDKTKKGFSVDIYEGSRQILRLPFIVTEHSGEYALYFKIDAKRGVLEVYVYDSKYEKWINDLTLSQRTYNIKE